jgi:RND family efflux transporter MFP subunit
MTRGWLASGIVALVVVAFTAGYLLAGLGNATPSPYPTPTDSPGTSARPTATPRPTGTPNATPSTPDTSVTASAVVVPVKSADLSVPVSGIVSFVVKPDQVVYANDKLLQLDQSTILARIKVANADLQHAQAAENSAQLALNDLPPDATPDEVAAAQAQLQLAQAEAAQASAELAQAQTDLKQTQVFAPFDGTITSVDVSDGEQTIAGQPVITIADLSSWLIETTDLSELEVVRIAVGDRATITFGALPNVTLGGTVARIQLRGTSNDGGVLFAVLIQPDSVPAGLRWSMSATVHIQPSS